MKINTVFKGITQYIDIQPSVDNPLISTANLKVFSLGLSANSTEFTEDVSREAVSRMIGTPIVGKYNIRDKDYSRHTNNLLEYTGIGYVPQDATISFEDFDDGKRWCVIKGVHLWTGLYGDLADISGKSQSMELTDDYEGEWYINDKKEPVFKFSKFSIQALTVLGRKVKPGFPGAKFYSQLGSEIKTTEEMIEAVRLYTAQSDEPSEEEDGVEEPNSENESTEGSSEPDDKTDDIPENEPETEEESSVDTDNSETEEVDEPSTNYSKEVDGMAFIKVAMSGVVSQLYTALNPENSEGERILRYSVLDLYSKEGVNYADVYDYDTGNMYRQYYSFKSDGLTLGEKEQVQKYSLTKDEVKSIEDKEAALKNSLKEYEEIGDVNFVKELYAQHNEAKKELIAKYEMAENEDFKDIDVTKYSKQELEDKLIVAKYRAEQAKGKTEEKEVGGKEPDTVYSANTPADDEADFLSKYL